MQRSFLQCNSETHWDGGDTPGLHHTLGTCHPAGLGGQVFGIAQSSLEADVVPPQLGEHVMVGNKQENPVYHEHSPALAPNLDPHPQTSPTGSEALETQSMGE